MGQRVVADIMPVENTHLEFVLKAYRREPSGAKQRDDIPCVLVVRVGAKEDDEGVPVDEDEEEEKRDA